jgi:sensor domain CHASE-containing protein
MLKVLLTMFAAIVLIVGGAVTSNAHQTGANDHHKQMTRHHNVAQHPSRDITSFSSSSVLHVGVNHPPKNR